MHEGLRKRDRRPSEPACSRAISDDRDLRHGFARFIFERQTCPLGGHCGRRMELLDFRTLTGETTMTEDRLPLNELLQKAGDGDFLRAVAESVLQLLMEADVEGLRRRPT